MRSQHLLVLFSCLLLVGACGDDDGGGGGADAGDEVDADTSDGGQQVTACGLQLTFPEASRRAGARVVFSLPDGTIFGEAVTDVDGTASRDDCQPGTLITFDLATTAGGGPGGGTFIDAYTIAGVSPGDTVLFPEPQAEPFEANLSVNVPAADGISSNFSFLSNGCSSAFVSFPLTERQLGVSEACLGSDQTVDVVAILRQGNDLVGYSGVTGVAVAEGQTTDVDLPAFTNASADADLVVTTSNPPAGTTVDAQASQGRDLVSLFGSSSEVIAGTANLDLLPSTLADFMDLRVLALASRDPIVRTDIYTRSALATTASVDLSTALPLVRGMSASFTDGSLVISWQADGSVADADHGSAVVFFRGTGVAGRWTVVFPTDGGSSYTVSQLPQAFGVAQAPDLEVSWLGFFEYDWLDYQGAITGGLRTNVQFGPAAADTTTLDRTWRSSGQQSLVRGP